MNISIDLTANQNRGKLETNIFMIKIVSDTHVPAICSWQPVVVKTSQNDLVEIPRSKERSVIKECMLVQENNRILLFRERAGEISYQG